MADATTEKTVVFARLIVLNKKHMQKKIILTSTIFLVIICLAVLAYLFLNQKQVYSLFKNEPKQIDVSNGSEDQKKPEDKAKEGGSGQASTSTPTQHQDFDVNMDPVAGDVEKTLEAGFNPGRDNDEDGLKNYQEIQLFNTDPEKKDTDGDGIDDKREIERGSDPTDPDDYPQK